MKDAVLVGVLNLAFATLVTVHVAIAFGLARQSPRWRALLALIVPPLAPYWALRLGMVTRGIIWVAAVVVYTTFLGIASV
jgi:hypothetical protein